MSEQLCGVNEWPTDKHYYLIYGVKSLLILEKLGELSKTIHVLIKINFRLKDLYISWGRRRNPRISHSQIILCRLLRQQ